jgi:riboflavin kinase/FMN adenylyltransferase
VVTIGTFDGVHLGHRMVIERLKNLAKKYDGETVIFTFYPHPRLVTAPDETNLRLLTTLDEKKELFELMGIDHLVIYPFTKEFSQLSYAEFVQQILAGQIKTRCLVVGYDHNLGKTVKEDSSISRSAPENIISTLRNRNRCRSTKNM